LELEDTPACEKAEAVDTLKRHTYYEWENLQNFAEKASKHLRWKYTNLPGTLKLQNYHQIFQAERGIQNNKD